MEHTKNRLLVVDDEENNRDMLSRRLERRGYTVDVAVDGPNAYEKICAAHYDLVLLDQMMPGMSGLDLLTLLRTIHSPTELPVIMVTAMDQSKTVVEALNGGANDYVTKPVDMAIITARIEAQLSRAQSARQNQTKQRETDELTGLGNRQMLVNRLESAIAGELEVALLMVDLDEFKLVNDRSGHGVGDRILVEIGTRLRDIATDFALGSDAIARIGGDEFAILIHRETCAAEPSALADEVLNRMRLPFKGCGSDAHMTASIGIVDRTTGERPEDVLRNADLAMCRAKNLGKNCRQIFHPNLLARARAQVKFDQDLHHAVARGELFAVYQSKVDLRTRNIVGFEALLRWRHPERGVVSPDEFIPAAEENGLIIPFGAWILREACNQLRTWQRKFVAVPPLTMNVNLSVKQLYDPHLLAYVRQVLQETGIDPSTLKLELTESSAINEFDMVRDTLAKLQAIGLELKLDDFGTGYSSLKYLGAMHFNSLKIDKSFVAKMNHDSGSAAIVENVIRLAHTLHMSVVAEGVEDEEQAAKLAMLGCGTGQGYLFSRPLAAESMEALIEFSFAHHHP